MKSEDTEAQIYLLIPVCTRDQDWPIEMNSRPDILHWTSVSISAGFVFDSIAVFTTVEIQIKWAK